MSNHILAGLSGTIRPAEMMAVQASALLSYTAVLHALWIIKWLQHT
jgi:hypothetical protein